MLHKKYSPVTVTDRFIALKAFINYLASSGYLIVSPITGIKKPKIPKVHARTFTNKEIQLLLNAFPDREDFIQYRNHVIMCILFGTGMRKAELLGLTVLDIHLDICIISVIGKGNKEREIPISPVLKRVLKRYLSLREMYCKSTVYNSSFLIITKAGNKLSVSGLDEIFRRLKNELDIPKGRLSPHTFRHSFAKAWLLNNGSLILLQQILGHEDIATTRIYVDYTSAEIRVQNDRFNPLDNSKWSYY